MAVPLSRFHEPLLSMMAPFPRQNADVVCVTVPPASTLRCRPVALDVSEIARVAPDDTFVEADDGPVNVPVARSEVPPMATGTLAASCRVPDANVRLSIS